MSRGGQRSHCVAVPIRCRTGSTSPRAPKVRSSPLDGVAEQLQRDAHPGLAHRDPSSESRSGHRPGAPRRWHPATRAPRQVGAIGRIHHDAHHDEHVTGADIVEAEGIGARSIEHRQRCSGPRPAPRSTRSGRPTAAASPPPARARGRKRRATAARRHPPRPATGARPVENSRSCDRRPKPPRFTTVMNCMSRFGTHEVVGRHLQGMGHTRPRRRVCPPSSEGSWCSNIAPRRAGAIRPSAHGIRALAHRHAGGGHTPVY